MVDGINDSPKLLIKIRASGSMMDSLYFPSHAGLMPWEGTPGGRVWLSNHVIHSWLHRTGQVKGH